MNSSVYLQAVETINDFDNAVVVSDLGLTINGTRIDVITYSERWEGGGKSFHFYAGNPLLDGTDKEEEWEEIILTDEQEEDMLKELAANL